MARRIRGEGSVFKRSDGRIVASALYEGKRITKYGKTKKEAWESLQAYLDDLKAGKIVTGPKQTVEQYLTQWLENEHRLQIGPVTLQQYRSVLRAHLIPAFGGLPLEKLKREHIQVFCSEKLDSGLAPGSVVFYYTVLSAALAAAVEHGLLARNVCDGVVLPRISRGSHQALNKEQAVLLVEAARGRRLWFLILMGVTTGARLGELLALHWEDIDVNTLRIHIHRTVSRIVGKGHVERDQPKTEKGSRKLIITQSVLGGISEQKEYIEYLRDKAGDRWKDLELVFPNRNGVYMDVDVVEAELKDIFIRAGLEPRTFHKLRHSAATILFAAGVNPKVVQEMLGHSSINITLGLYGDVLPDMQQGVADIMNDIF